MPISEQAAIQFLFSDNSGKVRVPSVAANNEHRPPKDRVTAIAEVNDRGLQFESSWIQRPPVQDPSFISRLNKERAVNLRLSRLKLDPWHWMDRYSRTLSKPHALYPLFMSCLRDALFYLNKGDVEMRRMELIDRGLDATEAARILKSFFTQRGRCRRVIPQRTELAIRVQEVFENFDGLTDNDGVPLVTEKVRIKHRQCMEHVWSGCLSDVPGIPMYFECGTKGGLPRYATLRGTSQLECYHRWLRACISGSRIGAGLFKDLLAHFNYRWNHRCDIRSRGGTNYGTYSIWILEQVAERSGRRAAEPIFPGLVPPVSRAAVLAKGIDLDAVGFRMPSAQPSAFTQPAATCMDGDGAEGPGEDDIDNDGADS